MYNLVLNGPKGPKWYQIVPNGPISICIGFFFGFKQIESEVLEFSHLIYMNSLLLVSIVKVSKSVAMDILTYMKYLKVQESS